MSSICEHRAEYRDWLIAMVHGEGYSKLLECMMDVYMDPESPLMQYGNNIDRLKDCDTLRESWDSCYVPPNKNCRGYSALEMTIALAGRMAFIVGGDSDSPIKCFWELIKNLGFYELDNESFEYFEGREMVRETIREIEKNVQMNEKNGQFFPMKRPNYGTFLDKNGTEMGHFSEKMGRFCPKNGQNGTFLGQNGTFLGQKSAFFDQKMKEIWYQMNEYLEKRV